MRPDRAGPRPAAAGHAHGEGGGGQAGPAVPDLESGLDVDQVPRAAEVAPGDRVGDEGLQVQVADRGGVGRQRVRDLVPGLPAVPDVVAAAADADVAGDLGAERLHGPVVVQPDHQLGAVGLAAGGRRLVEPDVVGHVVVVAAAGLGGAPAGGHPAGRNGRRGEGEAAARRARTPVAALVNGRVAARIAVGRVVDRGAGHREIGVAVGADALGGGRAPLVVLDRVGVAADRCGLEATQRRARGCRARGCRGGGRRAGGDHAARRQQRGG